MHDSFDVFEYIDFLRARWKFLARGVRRRDRGRRSQPAFCFPKRYTATATILIDPPAGGDPRIATAVSTVYLESLKTYELLATQRPTLRARRRAVPSSRPRRIAHRIAEAARAEGGQTPRHAGTPRSASRSPIRRPPRPWRSSSRKVRWNSAVLEARKRMRRMIEDAAKAAETAKGRLNDAESRLAKGRRSALRGSAAVGSFRRWLSEIARRRAASGGAVELAGGSTQAQPDVDASRARVEVLERRIGELTRAMDAEERDAGAADCTRTGSAGGADLGSRIL